MELEAKPLPLREWLAENKPSNDLNYANSFWRQVLFVEEVLAPSLKAEVFVASSHRSKSVKLPVYELRWPGAVVRMRNNFYDWKVSYEGKLRAVTKELLGLCPYAVGCTADTRRIPSCYCEGFAEEWVHDRLGYGDGRRFTEEVASGEGPIFAFLWLLKSYTETES